MELGEDFYSLAFYGYYKQPENQILERLDEDQHTQRKLKTIFGEQLN